MIISKTNDNVAFFYPLRILVRAHAKSKFISSERGLVSPVPMLKGIVFTKTSYDPSAGSPTETLLRLLLPLSAPVRVSSCRSPLARKLAVRQSKNLTGTLNR